VGQGGTAHVVRLGVAAGEGNNITLVRRPRRNEINCADFSEILSQLLLGRSGCRSGDFDEFDGHVRQRDGEIVVGGENSAGSDLHPNANSRLVFNNFGTRVLHRAIDVIGLRAFSSNAQAEVEAANTAVVTHSQSRC